MALNPIQVLRVLRQFAGVSAQLEQKRRADPATSGKDVPQKKIGRAVVIVFRGGATFEIIRSRLS